MPPKQELKPDHSHVRIKRPPPLRNEEGIINAFRDLLGKVNLNTTIYYHLNSKFDRFNKVKLRAAYKMVYNLVNWGKR